MSTFFSYCSYYGLLIEKKFVNVKYLHMMMMMMMYRRYHFSVIMIMMSIFFFSLEMITMIMMMYLFQVDGNIDRKKNPLEKKLYLFNAFATGDFEKHIELQQINDAYMRRW